MNTLLQHLPVLPIVTPLLVGAAMLLLADRHRGLRVSLAIGSLLIQLAAAAGLLWLANGARPDLWSEGIGVYAIGAWPPPFGISLVVDRLAAMMVTLAATVSLAVLVYSLSHWDRPAQPFYSLYQFLMVGLHGVFLTGDVFNLFVFLEVMLAASYGLLMRGMGGQRVRKALQYIAVNIAASILLLIGIALIYGVVGTLNMAEVFARVPALAPPERALFDAGGALLGIAFLVKAGSWPLNFWLPGTYSAAVAPVAASFAMLTKVGVYAVLRTGSLIEDDAAASILGSFLFYIGLATLISGTIGMLATERLARFVSFSVIVSSGLLLAWLGLGIEALTAPLLFYLAASVLTTAAFFMLTGMTDRTRMNQAAPQEQAEAPDLMTSTMPPTPHYLGFGVREPDPYGTDDEVGMPIPAAMAFLGLIFVCCALLVTGLPPLPGFIAKITLLATALESVSFSGFSGGIWTLIVAVLVTGFAAVIALLRIGARLFWTGTARRKPRLSVLEAAPLAALILLCLMMSAASGRMMVFFEDTARTLHTPEIYIRAVLSSQPDTVQPEDIEP